MSKPGRQARRKDRIKKKRTFKEKPKMGYKLID
jgi:hypothetical protein